MASLAGRGRPTHARVTVTSLQIAMDTHTPPRHYSLLHKRTLTESGSRLKACGGRGGEGRGGVCSRQSQCQQGGRPEPSPLPALAGLPWSPGCGQEQLGCGEGLLAGRTSQTSRSWGQSTSHGGGSNDVLCILCRHLAERRASAPHAGTQAWVWPALAHSEVCSEPTSCGGWRVAGRPAGCKADRLCDPQLPIRPAPGVACRRARPGDTPLPLLLPPPLPLTLWRVNVLPENQSQKSPRCSQKRFSSNIDNRSLWKFMSMVAAIWRREKGGSETWCPVFAVAPNPHPHPSALAIFSGPTLQNLLALGLSTSEA